MPMSDHEKDRAQIAVEEGFTGTYAGFIAWLEASLVYGGVVVQPPETNEHGRVTTKVETITGGYSSDERLLGRVSRCVYMQGMWRSSHAGGRVVYEIAEWMVNSTEELVWLEPDNGVFERVYRVRTVRIYQEDTSYGQVGDFIELAYNGAAELSFHEPDRDINEPAGVLTIRPLPVPELL